MKKGKKIKKFAPIFKPSRFQVIVEDGGMPYVGRILDIQQIDGAGGILIIVRHK